MSKLLKKMSLVLSMVLCISMIQPQVAQASQQPETFGFVPEAESFKVTGNYDDVTKPQKTNITIALNRGKCDFSTFLQKGKKFTWKSSNIKVAKVTNKGMVYPVSLGTCTITAKYNDKVILEVKTTVGKNLNTNRKEHNKKAWKDQLLLSMNRATPEFAKDVIFTVPDLVRYLVQKNYWYNNNTPILSYENWTWAFNGATSLETNFGVCCDVANVASYILQDDYDDLGFILISGRFGHIYNYVKQDGIYYVFDLTMYSSMIASGQQIPYDFNWIWSGKNLDDYKEIAMERCGANDPEQGVGLILYYSAQGHESSPANYISNIHDTKGYATEHVEIGFEEGVEVHTLFKNPKMDYNVVFFKTSEIPVTVPVWGKRSNDYLTLFNGNRPCITDVEVVQEME